MVAQSDSKGSKKDDKAAMATGKAKQSPTKVEDVKHEFQDASGGED